MNDLHEIWSHRWVTSKAKQGHSGISGNGLIAVDDISKNAPIIVYGGVIIPRTDLPTYRKEFGNYDVPFDEDFSIAPTSKEEIISKGSLNHSCEPNLGWKNSLILVAIRDIKKEKN